MPTFTGWTNAGAGVTVTQESTIIRHGTYSAKIVAGGGAAGQMTQTFGTVSIDTLTGKTAYLEGWVYATAASTARIRLDWDGTNFDSCAYHSGTDQWEYQKLAVAVPTTATQVKAILEVAAGGTAYFDAVWGGVSPVQKYTIPTSMLRGPFQVLQQADELQPEGNYYPLTSYARPTAGRRLRLIGMGLLSQPTTDAGTVEIDTNQAEYFLAHASQWLYRAIRQGGSQQEREYIGQLRQEWQQDIERMERNGTTMPNMAAEIPIGTWKVEEDSTAKSLIFTQKR